VEQLASEPLAERADALVRRLGEAEAALLGAFPGSPHAITAIEVVASGWRTWHVYPQSGEIVSTVTTFRPRP